MTTIPAAASVRAGTGITEIEATEVRGLLESGQATLVDVREPDEHARERGCLCLRRGVWRFGRGPSG
jgi:hypothetical protein